MKSVALSLILMTVSHFATSSEPAWRTVEEVLAVVGDTPILHSDVELAVLLQILELDTTKVRESLIAGGGGEETLDRKLLAKGLVWPDVDELVLRIAAVNAFVDQRLLPRVSVSMEEIEAAYQDLLVKEIAASDEPIPPIATVREHLHQILVAQKLNDEIERWVVRAGERQEVMRFSR